jgi:hypothetical protein
MQRACATPVPEPRVMTTSSIAPATAADIGEARMRVTALLVATMWLEVLEASARTTHAAKPWLAALAGLAAQLAFTAGEAAAAGSAWRLIGRHVAWGVLAPRLLVASAAETLAVSVAAGRTHLPRAWALALAGPRAGEGAPSHGLAAAFAAVGLLALVRLLLSAWLQARAARARFRSAVTLVLALWLGSRLAVWWTFDLLQGRSFQP